MFSNPVVNSSNVLCNTTETVRSFSGNGGNTPDCHVEGAVFIKVLFIRSVLPWQMSECYFQLGHGHYPSSSLNVAIP
jgi:hypothetical protein